MAAKPAVTEQAGPNRWESKVMRNGFWRKHIEAHGFWQEKFCKLERKWIDAGADQRPAIYARIARENAAAALLPLNCWWCCCCRTE